jgi:hypothetical protein
MVEGTRHHLARHHTKLEKIMREASRDDGRWMRIT